MDKYVISEEEEILDAEPPFDDSLKSGVKVMELKKNTKFGHIIDYVNKMFEDETVRRVIFRGVGDAAEKCVSCVEVYKRKRQARTILDPLYALDSLNPLRHWSINELTNNETDEVDRADQADNHFAIGHFTELASDEADQADQVWRVPDEELYQWNALSTAKRVTYWDPTVEGMNRLKVTIDTPVIFIMLSRDPYPVELQCMSMQRTSDGAKKVPKPFDGRPARRGGKKPQRGGGPNKWARPSKEANEAETAERREILEKLEKKS